MDKKFKNQTGGLQEKKVKVELTKDEIKKAQADEKAKRREKPKADRAGRPNFFKRMWQRIRDVFGEMRKVQWPTIPKAFKQTGIVLAVVLIFALVVFGIDQGLGQLFNLLTKGLS